MKTEKSDPRLPPPPPSQMRHRRLRTGTRGWDRPKMAATEAVACDDRICSSRTAVTSRRGRRGRRGVDESGSAGDRHSRPHGEPDDVHGIQDQVRRGEHGDGLGPAVAASRNGYALVHRKDPSSAPSSHRPCAMFCPTAPGRGEWKRVFRRRTRPSRAAAAAVSSRDRQSRSHRQRPDSSQSNDGGELTTVADDVEDDNEP